MTNRKESALDTNDQDVKAGDFNQDFSADSGKIAIIDAALLDGIRNKLVDSAIVIPIKHDAVLSVSGKFDDAILRKTYIDPLNKHRCRCWPSGQILTNGVVVGYYWCGCWRECRVRGFAWMKLLSWSGCWSLNRGIR